ncbi:hypothetical protein JCM5353_001062 [Sporobolomyces roseus]
MFNRLPPELVRQIIESSVPSTHQRKIYCDRQILLRSLCLVCQLFRLIAQPLLLEFVWINCRRKSDALLNTSELKKPNWTIRQAVFEDSSHLRLDMGYLEGFLRSCPDLRSLTLQVQYSGRLDLSMLQDLPHLADLSLSALSDEDYQFPSSFRLNALTSLSIDYTTIGVAPTLLDPEVLPSLRSLAMPKTYNHREIAHLFRSHLADLVPQLEVQSLDSRIIRRGLDCLTPALSRTLFELYLPSSNDLIDILQVAQHLRMAEGFHLDEVFAEFVASIANQDRQISLRSIYLDISLKDLSSLPVDLVKAVQDLLRVCMEKRIEVIYEEQEVGYVGDLRPSEEFSRRQREINLRSLQLAATGVTFVSPIVLPHLEYLTFCGMVSEAVANILQPQVLPALRHLRIITSPGGDALAHLSKMRLSNLIPQLHSLFMDSGIIDQAPEYLIAAFDRTLFEFTPTHARDFRSWPRTIHHLQIPRDVDYHLLSQFTTSIREEEQSNIRLESLYLDGYLANYSASEEGDTSDGEEFGMLLDELRRVCCTKGIALVYEEQPDDWIDSWLSKEFCSRREVLGEIENQK